MTTNEVVRTMGRGLARLESYLPSTRGSTVFGELRHMLDQSPAAQRAAQQKVDGAAEFGATAAGMFAQYANERNRSFFGRHFGVSAKKRAEEAQMVQTLSMLGGTAAGAIARAKVRYDDKKHRESVGRLVWQVVNMAAIGDDGTLNIYNDALRWRVLDALDLDLRTRDRLATAPHPGSFQELQMPQLDVDARDAVATYAFHAYANAVDEYDAARRIVPLLVRLGMSKSAGEHFARTAQAEYQSERDPLSYHYRSLQLAVVGIGRHLALPVDVITEAARTVVAFDPYEAARAENRRMVLQLVRASSAVWAALASGGIAPAMSIATVAAQQLFGGAADVPAIESAFVSVGQDANLPSTTVEGWLAWNQ